MTETNPRFDWLDSDICLAFPPINETALAEHGNFRPRAVDLSESEAFFLHEFDIAYEVQSMLGVTTETHLPVECDDSCSHAGEVDEIVGELYEHLTEIDDDGNSKLKQQLKEVAKCTAFAMKTGLQPEGASDGLDCVGS